MIASHSAVHVIPSPFVSLCVRDLRVYAGALNGSVLHYHDASGFEADAVVEPRGGTYALFEVKIGAWEIDNGAASLLKLARKVDASVMGAPAFCAVVTPGGYAHRQEDGVLMLPITCLAPDAPSSMACPTVASGL